MTQKFAPEPEPLELLLTPDVLDKAARLEGDGDAGLDAVVERLISRDFERLVLRPTDSLED